MTSDTAKRDVPRKSKAQIALDIVLGEKRVTLGQLSVSELQGLLKSQLCARDSRELHGFTELKDALRRRGDEPLEVSDTPAFISFFPKEYPFTLKSHVVSVYRGWCLSRSGTWRRNETSEETSDFRKALEWNRDGYLYRGKERRLFMRRLQEFCWEADILAEVAYNYVKVPNEKRYVINEISSWPVSISGFCKHFGKKAPEVASGLLSELSGLYRQTAEALENRARLMRLEASKRAHLVDRID